MKIEEGVDKITTSVEASSAPPVTTQVPSLEEAMRMVKECGAKERTALMHTSILLIMKPEGREVLKLFETNEGRLDFLEREHAKLWMWSDAYIHMFNFLLYSICMSRSGTVV
jgi:hypothetical protein